MMKFLRWLSVFVKFLANLHSRHHQVLSYENSLPIPDASVDYIILIHAIENSHNPSSLLEEAFRILKGKGKLLVVTPNRRGLWAQSTNTPFGYGHPYTMTQLTTLLNENNFTPVRSTRCLYVPPSQNRLILKLTPFFHHIGKVLFRKFSGLTCVESVKSVYHPISIGARKKGIAVLSKSQGKMIEVI
jgi:SAM-dependent methyltransferase